MAGFRLAVRVPSDEATFSYDYGRAAVHGSRICRQEGRITHPLDTKWVRVLACLSRRVEVVLWTRGRTLSCRDAPIGEATAMHTYSTWQIEPTKILTRRELACVLADLRTRVSLSESTQLNLVIFRLACCCGLRASEIAGLRCDDVIVGLARPFLRIRAKMAKGGRGRQVPLWWDAGTLADLEAWKATRAAQGNAFVCCQKPSRCGEPLLRHSLRRRFLTACKVLGRERLRTLTIHHGRHTFISHALAGGRSLAEVRVAAGHSNISVTSAYLHIAVDDEGQLGSLFAAQSS